MTKKMNMKTSAEAANLLMMSLGLRVTMSGAPKKSKLNRSLLPSPETYWTTHGITLKSKKGWSMAKCIFHDDHHASLSINFESGGFFCHACSAKGGDVLAAHQLLHGCDFMSAAKALGAWEGK